MKKNALAILCCLTILLGACSAPQASTPAPETVATTIASTAPPPAPTAEPTHTPAPVEPSPTTEPPTPTAVSPSATPPPALPLLPPEPQRIEFESEDGTLLVGMYYPAAVNPAPVVVLMHWAGGDKNDWVYVGMAAWLQNRGLEVPAAPGSLPFDTPYPFPPLPADRSYAVFLFDFRDFGESAPANQSFSQLAPLWEADARAAYARARELEGVDSGRVAGIGASIGADAVVDACGEGCLGALSLGPGSYLVMPYPEAVKIVDEAGKLVWCVGAEDDPPAVQACRAASGEVYQSQIYPSGGHAMQLFQVDNDLQPTIDSLIVEFLELVFP